MQHAIHNKHTKKCTGYDAMPRMDRCQHSLHVQTKHINCSTSRQLTYWRQPSPVTAMQQLEHAVEILQRPERSRNTQAAQSSGGSSSTHTRAAVVACAAAPGSAQFLTSRNSSRFHSTSNKHVAGLLPATAADLALFHRVGSVCQQGPCAAGPYEPPASLARQGQPAADMPHQPQQGTLTQSTSTDSSSSSRVTQLQPTARLQRSTQQWRQLAVHTVPQPSSLTALLAQYQQQHRQQHMQQEEDTSATATAAATAATGARLDRKLTAVLTDSCTSWHDVADVLLAADSAGRLNALHVAAALATLARLAAAQRASASAATGSSHAVNSSGSSSCVIGVVPLGPQQYGQMKGVRGAAAAAVAAGYVSRWHLPPGGSPAAAVLLEQDDCRPPCTDGGQPAAASSINWEWEMWEAAEEYNNYIEDDEADDMLSAKEEADRDGQLHLVEQLGLAVQHFWPSMSAATVTSCCWSVAVLGYVLPQALLPQVGSTLLGMTQHLAGTPGTASSSSNSSSSSLSCDAAELPRQLVLLLWSLAKMGVDTHDLQPQQMTLACQQQQQQGGSGTDVVAAVLCGLTPHLPRLSSQGLVMLMWASGAWRLQLPTAAGRTQAPLSPTTRAVTLASSAAASTDLSADPAAALLDATAAAMARQDVIPQGLAITLWGVARMGLTPGADWLAAWLASMRAALPACSTHDCAMSVWALATLGLAPPGEWLSALCWRAAEQAQRFEAAELPALLWGLARLRFRPPLLVAQQLLERGQALAISGRLSPQGLSLMIWATSALGFAPRASWVDQILVAVADYLPLFRPVEASALLTGLVRMQHIPHQSWMEVWWQESEALLPAAGAQQLVLLLWSAVRLGQAPPRSWFRVWLACSARAMAAGQVTAQGYGIMWSALAQLAQQRQQPGPAWMNVYFRASSRSAVLQQLGCLAAEQMLSGLAQQAQHSLAAGLAPPGYWAAAFLAATQPLLASAKAINISVMLQAAGQLQLVLPRSWLDAAMDRLQVLLEAEGLISNNASSTGNRGGSGSDTSSNKGHLSFVLSARLQRRWLAMQLQRVLAGLRAQQMLAMQRRPTAAAVAATAADRHSPVGSGSRGNVEVGVADALSAWPWLPAAVFATWPDRQSAQQALRALSGRDVTQP